MTIYSDADLLAYLDGAVSPEAAAQIEGSPELIERARRLARAEAGLRRRLFRADCPDPHQLGEYHLGLLPAGQASAIRQHLGRCPHCSAELSRLEAFMAPGLLERARLVVASLVSGPALGNLAAAGVRGGEPGLWLFAAGEVQISLEMQAEARQPDLRQLSGLVIGGPASDMEALLLAGDQFSAAAPVGDLGDFSFPGLAPGTYALHLLTTEEEIHIPPFTIE